MPVAVRMEATPVHVRRVQSQQGVSQSEKKFEKLSYFETNCCVGYC
jgi:hypothetical protein